MRNILNDLLNFIFPNLCVVCNLKLLDGEKHICLHCLQHLPTTGYHLQPDNRLEDFFAGRIPFERIAAYTYFVHGGSVQKIVHELKYRRNPDIGHYIGQLCGNSLDGSDFLNPIDILVPVPLHKKREKMRGYNQSLELCKGIAQQTGINIDTASLVRKVNNKSQTKNSRFDRWANVENIFEITDNAVFEDKHVLLVDDIITTGSTIESCAKELLKCKGCKVSIFAFGVAT